MWEPASREARFCSPFCRDNPKCHYRGFESQVVGKQPSLSVPELTSRHPAECNNSSLIPEAVRPSILCSQARASKTPPIFDFIIWLIFEWRAKRCWGCVRCSWLARRWRALTSTGRPWTGGLPTRYYKRGMLLTFLVRSRCCVCWCARARAVFTVFFPHFLALTDRAAPARLPLFLP